MIPISDISLKLISHIYFTYIYPFYKIKKEKKERREIKRGKAA